MQAANTEMPHYCGSTSAYVLLRLNGIDIDFNDIVDLPVVKDKKLRLSLLDLKVITNSHGLSMECVEVSIDQLKLLQKPVVIHLNIAKKGNHFVPGWATEEGFRFIDFPETGLAMWEQVERFYTGYALVDLSFTRPSSLRKRSEEELGNRVPVGYFEGPKFHWLNGNSIDIGRIRKEDARKDSSVFRFAFANIGNETLVISDVKASCTCLSVRANRHVLEPGEVSGITVFRDVNDTGIFSEFCYFKTNDKTMRIGKATARGEIVSPFKFAAKPSKCAFGVVTPDRVYSKALVISSPVRLGQTPIQIDKVTNTLTDSIGVSLEREWREQDDGFILFRETTLTVSLSPNLPPGAYEDAIEIIHDSGKLTVPVSFTVGFPVESTRTVFVFRLSDRDVFKKIVLKTDRVVGFTVEHVESTVPWLAIVPSNALNEESEMHEIGVKLVDREKGLRRGMIDLSGKSKTQEWNISIPVICMP